LLRIGAIDFSAEVNRVVRLAALLKKLRCLFRYEFDFDFVIPISAGARLLYTIHGRAADKVVNLHRNHALLDSVRKDSLVYRGGYPDAAVKIVCSIHTHATIVIHNQRSFVSVI
jgi:hypothetical protein